MQRISQSQPAAYAGILGILLFAVVMASTGLDLRNSIALPVVAAAFATYSLIACLIERRKKNN